VLTLQKKSPAVNLDVISEFKGAEPILRTAWTMYGSVCVVTSGRDGTHSRQSVHDEGKALDLRISNLPLQPGGLSKFGANLAISLVQCLGPYWYLVLEKDHFHLEYCAPGDRPNIIQYRQGQHFYVQGVKV
jgi:hypothetical protein